MSRRSRPPRGPGAGAVLRSLDEASYGPGRTLNLRVSLPTAAEATARTESWLRERQMAQAREVLVITGRGKSSDGGVAVLKPAVERLLFTLRRKGVVEEWREHNEGSFSVSLAPVTALFDAPKRNREASPARPVPGALAGLSPSTLELLRAVAVGSLNGLGVPAPGEAFIGDEMIATFSKMSGGLPPSAGREDALQAALRHALVEMEE